MPQDIAEIAWISIGQSNTKLGKGKDVDFNVDFDDFPDAKAESFRAMRRAVREDLKRLDELLGDEWDVKLDDNVITLTSTFDVYFISRMPGLQDMPQFTPGQDLDNLKKRARPEKLVARLVYSPRLDDEEYKARYIEKRKLIDTMVLESLDEKEYVEMARKVKALEVPTHRYKDQGYDLYLVDNWLDGYSVYPVEALAKVGAASNLTRAYLKTRYKTGQ